MGQERDDLKAGAALPSNNQPSEAPVLSATGGGEPSPRRGDLPEMRAELEHIRTDISQTIEAIEAKLTPEHLAQEAAGRIQLQVHGQKGQIADAVSTAAQALRQTGDQLRGQNQGAVAEYFDGAAEQVNRLSRSVRDRDVGQLIGEVERFARRQPGLFAGSAFAIGLIGARFLKSSSEASRGSGTTGSMIQERGGSGTEIYGPGFEGMNVPRQGGMP